MATLCLHLLGPFQAEVDGRPLVGLPAKARALMAFLAVEVGRAHRRADLAELLWPERPPGVALANLRYALRDLRTVLGQRFPAADPPPPRSLLLSTHYTLQLDPQSDHWLDVAEFQGLTCLGDLSALEQAVALYRGPFLEDLSVGSAAFEEWVLFRREQLERQMIATLRRLAALYEAAGRLPEAIPHARRLLELDSWDEAAHRQLMRLLALDGRRSAALAQYEACRRVLGTELGLAPAAETTALAEAIRVGGLAQAGVTAQETAPATSESSVPPPTPFVGRERELERLDRVLERALAGRAQVAFVTGEAGAGKTVLLAEFARGAMARHPNLVAASGDCAAPVGSGDPYLPIRDILGLLTGEVEGRQAVGSLTPEHARRLAALLPVIAQALCQVGPDLVGTFLEAEPLALRLQAVLPRDSPWGARLAERAESARHAGAAPPMQAALFDQVTHLFQTMARQQPLLLTLDNLQWVDQGTASLLFHLALRLGASRVLIVGAYRPAVVALGRPGSEGLGKPLVSDAGPAYRHPLEPVLHELGRQRGKIEVSLDEANDQVFVEAILDSEPNRLGAAFRRTLAEHTAGNPLFTTELLRSLEERGSLVRDATGHWVAGTAPDWGHLPARVEAVIAERIGRLPEACQEILSTASVEGLEFSAEVAARVLGVDRAVVVRQLCGPICQQHRLAYPVGLRWLSAGGRRLSRYCFRHQLFQRRLYQRLDHAQRTVLHEAVGTALEALHGEGTVEIAPQLAWHFEQAGVAAKAAGYLLQSGERAVRLSAHEEAITLFRRGLALLQTLPDSPERARQQLALLLALALGPSLPAQRGWGAAEHVEACERAALLCRALDKAEQLRAVLFQLANLHQARGDRSSRPMGGELRPSAEAPPPLPSPAEGEGASPREAMDCLELGESFVFVGESIAAQIYLERCLAACLALPGHRLTITGIDVEVVCLSWLMVLLCKQGHLDQARERSRQGLARARALDDPMSLAFASLVCGLDLHVMRREPEVVRQAAEPLLEAARAKGLALFESHARIRLGWAQAMLGDIEPGMEALQEGLADPSMVETTLTRPYQLSLRAEACLAASQARGEPGWAVQGLATVDQAQEIAQRAGLRHLEAELWRLRGELLLAAGSRRPPADGSRAASSPLAVQEAAAQAEACFRRALDVARGQEARLWELRAAVQLVRLLDRDPDRSDDRRQARQRLAEVYSWFGEGSDTLDLAEARVLLEEL